VPLQVNKRVVESLIKAGAFDCFGVTRKQMMTVYIRMMEEQVNAAKNNMAGQLSLFDIVPEEARSEFRIHYPDVGEYKKEMKLAFEKEVLGIYVSGHPLEDYEALWKGHITAKTADFVLDEETGTSRIRDNQDVTVGGIITEVKIKYTKNNQVMAFVTLEDLTGSMEIIVFPKTYETYADLLKEDAKVFIQGRASQEEERDSKLLASSVVSFDAVPREVWIRFHDTEEYKSGYEDLMKLVDRHGGRDQVVIYVEKPRGMKKLPAGQGIRAGEETLEELKTRFGSENVTVR
jgi:DNA polymerase III subunit alpha